jgi:lysophospholipase L1-like esterase
VLVDVAPPQRGLVGTVAVLGDSVGVGIGDPVLGGGWRGFAPLLAEALGAPTLANLSISGSRIGCVAETQLPAAIEARPDVAVVIVGMNDTMRSGFDPVRLGDHLDRVVTRLRAVGTTVVTIRYHDHQRVFPLPGPLRRALGARIAALNEILDAVVGRHGIPHVDLGGLPGIYLPAAWAVDRLHPSELGHRMLARAIVERLAESGVAVPGEVSLACTGGRPAGPLAHWGWLVFKGVPWLFRRGRDLIPYAARAVMQGTTPSLR